MARRKAVEVEALPPEEEQPKRGRKKLVDAKHTITYEAPVPVTVEDTEENELVFDDDIEEIEEKPKRKPLRNEREELRRKLAQNHVTPGSDLKLSIERYLHSESGDGGVWAETEFCTKYACIEAHITNEDYLDVARKWGVGKYRFTLRMNNKIVTAWDKRISAASMPPTPMIQNSIPGDPTSPQVIVMPQQPQQPIGVVDPIQQAKAQHALFKDKMEEYKLMKEVFSVGTETKEETPAESFMNHPKVIDTMVDTIVTVAKKAAGLKGESSGGDDGWTGVAMEIVKTGQVKDLAGVVQVAIQTLIGGVLGGNNGQAQMATTPQQTGTGSDLQQANSHTAASHQMQPQSAPGNDPRGIAGTAQSLGDVSPASQQVAVSPEDQALHLVIDHCRRKLPPRLACDRLMAYADAINEQAPQYSIDYYIGAFAQMEIEDALAFVKEQPGGPEVEALPHSREWTREFQRLIQENTEGEE